MDRDHCGFRSRDTVDYCDHAERLPAQCEGPSWKDRARRAQAEPDVGSARPIARGRLARGTDEMVR